jgi:intracellular sulfur oxidation DsrE/DsrF family protein
MTTSRRGLLGLFSLAAAGAGAKAASAAPQGLDMEKLKKDADVACLYHADFGDPARFSQMLNNINNHYSVYDSDPFKVKLVIVAHSAAIKFFLSDLSGTPWEKETIDPEIYKRFIGLTKFGLEVYLCQITYKRLKIDPAKTRTDAALKFVPSGVATVAELQGKGFAYLKVG